MVYNISFISITNDTNSHFPLKLISTSQPVTLTEWHDSKAGLTSLINPNNYGKTTCDALGGLRHLLLNVGDSLVSMIDDVLIVLLHWRGGNYQCSFWIDSNNDNHFELVSDIFNFPINSRRLI